MTLRSIALSTAAAALIGLSFAAAPASAKGGVSAGASLTPLFGIGAGVGADKKGAGVGAGVTFFGLTLGTNIGARSKTNHQRLRNQFTPPRPGLGHDRFDGEGFYFR